MSKLSLKCWNCGHLGNVPTELAMPFVRVTCPRCARVNVIPKFPVTPDPSPQDVVPVPQVEEIPVWRIALEEFGKAFLNEGLKIAAEEAGKAAARALLDGGDKPPGGRRKK